MTIMNIRGTSGSGKSTLVKMLLDTFDHFPVMGRLGDWKKPKCIGYIIPGPPSTFVVGRYETQCGGCDSMSYKGSHEDIEALVREGATKGYNVVFEGLTISSTLTRWKRIADEFGDFWWTFMKTSEEECHARILDRNGGREPKHHDNGLADYQIKHRACMRQSLALQAEHGNHVAELESDDESFNIMLALLGLCDLANQTIQRRTHDV